MANTNFQISFTVDLNPYKEGLKSMLNMTASTGQQLKPLLNMEVKAPDFSGLEAELTKYEEKLKEVRQTGEDMATPKPFDDLPPKVDNSNKKINEHTIGLNKAKREALETFGAISFLTQGVVGMASSMDGGNERLDKLNSGMSQGISAGFGLASMLSMLQIASGGTAAAIGGIVAGGTALISFFTESKKKNEEATIALDNYKKALAGAPINDLKKHQEDVSKNLETMRADLNKAKAELELLEKKKTEWGTGELPKVIPKTEDELKAITAKKNEIEEASKAIANQEKLVGATGEVIKNQEMSAVDVIKFTNEAKIASTKDRYDREVGEAKSAWEKQKVLIENSSATEQQKRDAIEAGETLLNQKMIEIYDAQEAEFVQHKEEEERRAEESRKRLEGIQAETTKALNEAEKQRELAKATSARERVAIEERYAIAESKIQEELAIKFAKTQEEETAIHSKFSAERDRIRALSSANFIEAEKRDIIAAKQAQEEKIRLWREEHQASAGFIDATREGFRTMWSDSLLVHREAVSVMDAMWISFENTALSAMGNIVEKYIEDSLTRIAMGETETIIAVGQEEIKQAANITTMQTSAAAGTTKAAESAAAIPFPANLIAIGAAIAASITLFAGIREAFGFEHGGRLRKGDVGFIEGYGSEIIAPERTFQEIMYKEFIPRQVVQSGGAGGTNDTNLLRKEIRSLRSSFEKMPSRVELKQKGSDLYAIWETSGTEIDKRKL